MTMAPRGRRVVCPHSRHRPGYRRPKGSARTWATEGSESTNQPSNTFFSNTFMKRILRSNVLEFEYVMRCCCSCDWNVSQPRDKGSMTLARRSTCDQWHFPCPCEKTHLAFSYFGKLVWFLVEMARSSFFSSPHRVCPGMTKTSVYGWFRIP